MTPMHPIAAEIALAAQTINAGQSATVISTEPGVGAIHTAKVVLEERGLRVADVRCDMLFETDFTPIPYPVVVNGETVVRYSDPTASLHAAAKDCDVVILDYTKGALERLPTVAVFEHEFLAGGGRVLHIVTDHAAQSVREIAGNRFIAKRTKSGLVLRELERGQTKNQWFIRVDAKEDLGEAKRMSVGPNPTFTEIESDEERETVYFFARRAYNTGLIG